MTNEERIAIYETQLNDLADSIRANKNALDGKLADIAALDSQIETAENSIMLDVLEARFNVEGFPEYNKLRYTNAESRKAAQKLASDADADFQTLLNERKTLYAQMKTVEAQIESDRKKFRAAEIAMLFYSTNP